mgnify:CR=1 FL=1
MGAPLGGLAGLFAEAEPAPGGFSSIPLVDIVPSMDPNGAAKVMAFMSAHVGQGFGTLQEAADVIHEYLDAMITTVTDTKPDAKIPTSMTDLERPDLNSAGLVQLDTQNLVRGMTKTGGYWIDPTGSQSAYWVSALDNLASGRMQVGMCEYNEFQRLALENDYLIDGDAGTAYWDGQIAPTKPGWRIVTLLHQGTEKGRTGCAA